jgi:hypothetical protein
MRYTLSSKQQMQMVRCVLAVTYCPQMLYLGRRRVHRSSTLDTRVDSTRLPQPHANAAARIPWPIVHQHRVLRHRYAPLLLVVAPARALPLRLACDVVLVVCAALRVHSPPPAKGKLAVHAD